MPTHLYVTGPPGSGRSSYVVRLASGDWLVDDQPSAQAALAAARGPLGAVVQFSADGRQGLASIHMHVCDVAAVPLPDSWEAMTVLYMIDTSVSIVELRGVLDDGAVRDITSLSNAGHSVAVACTKSDMDGRGFAAKAALVKKAIGSHPVWSVSSKGVYNTLSPLLWSTSTNRQVADLTIRGLIDILQKQAALSGLDTAVGIQLGNELSQISRVIYNPVSEQEGGGRRPTVMLG
jgi:hypothetical protein